MIFYFLNKIDKHFPPKDLMIKNFIKNGIAIDFSEATQHTTIIECICDKCGKEYKRLNYNHQKMKKNALCDGDYCCKCWTGILNSRKEYREKMSYSLKEMRKNNPNLSVTISETSKSRGINAGNKNGMKRAESKAKVSSTRIKLFQKNPELRIQLSNQTRKAWADGKFDGVRVGQCKWFDYCSKNGTVHKVQGTWELAFIKWLDKNDFSFLCHRGRLPYNLNGQNKNYYPDFWVTEWNCYVDVKCKHFYNEEKFNAIRNCNKCTIKVLFKEDLLKLGVLL
jgi:hypothetical protein